MVCGIHGFPPTPQCWQRASYTGEDVSSQSQVTEILQICFYCKFRSVVWARAPQLVSLMPAHGTVDPFRRGCPATTAKLKNKTSTNQCANPSSRACVRVHARGGEGGSSQSDASDWSWRSARLYSRAVKQEDTEDQSRCVRWQLSESRRWTSSVFNANPWSTLLPTALRVSNLSSPELSLRRAQKFAEDGSIPGVSPQLLLTLLQGSLRCLETTVWLCVRYHADTYAEYVKLFFNSCSSDESLLPRRLCKV